MGEEDFIVNGRKIQQKGLKISILRKKFPYLKK